MPSKQPINTIQDHLDAYQRAVRGQRDVLADVRRGSGYDLVGGPSAVLWARQSARTRDLFRARFNDTAQDDDLDRNVESSYGVSRIVDAFGVGKIVLSKSTAGTGASSEVIYAGSRISVLRFGTTLPPLTYAVAQDTPWPSGATIAAIPIRATRTGAGVSANAIAGSLRIEDPLFDSTITATSLVCADGTERESDGAYLARARKTQRDKRTGYRKLIEDTCLAAGAAFVVALDAASLGDALDGGINNVYVADAGFSSPASLITACLIALDSARVCGADLQVLPMTQAALSVAATVRLWDDPGNFDLLDLAATIRASLVDSFVRRPKFWIFRNIDLQGAIKDSSDAVQTSTVVTTPGEPAIAFTATLTRYTLAASAIALTFTGPV